MNLEREEAIKKLKNMAYGQPNDAIKLLLEDPDKLICSIEDMDLTMLSEIKKGANGALEIKLINRLDAIQMLLEATEETENKINSDADALLEALVKAAAQNEQKNEQGDVNEN